jgi:hypothetical protein
MTTVDTTELERMIDRYGLAHVTEQLAYAGYCKAERVASNRQDTALANEWGKAGRAVERVVTNESVRSISN